MTDHVEILKARQKWELDRIGKPVSELKLSISIDDAIAELEMRRRGECICSKCGLRQDGEHAKGEF